MARYGFDDVRIFLTTASATTTFRDITDYCVAINVGGFEAVLQETHAAGDAWVERFYTGLRNALPITLTLFYDDLAVTGPHINFGNPSQLGSSHELNLSFDANAEAFHVDCIERTYNPRAVRGELTMVEMELVPTGAVTTSTASSG